MNAMEINSASARWNPSYCLTGALGDLCMGSSALCVGLMLSY